MFSNENELINLKSAVKRSVLFYLISIVNSGRHWVYFKTCFFFFLLWASHRKSSFTSFLVAIENNNALRNNHGYSFLIFIRFDSSNSNLANSIWKHPLTGTSVTKMLFRSWLRSHKCRILMDFVSKGIQK